MWRAQVSSALALLGSIAVLLLCPASAGAASLLDPRLGFHVLPSEHFVIYFHQGETAQAIRLRGIAEEVWHQLSASLAIPVPPLTHVILADQGELANGWATPLPRNTIFVTAAAPGGSEFIGRNTDWLRLVFTHEFTHIVHLDRSRRWATAARWIFGRTPIAFPNLFLPGWQIEGLASYQESALTGDGRLHAGDFRMIEREAARAGRFEPIDRVNGGLIDWPGGFGPYAYGLGFHDYLADRFGEATLGQLADATAARLPFLGSRAFRTVYGEPLGQLWADYRAQLERRPSPELTTAATRLTRHGQIVTGPRFAGRCDGCDSEIIYSARNPDAFPTLRSIRLDGSPSRQLTERYLGSTTGIGADVIVFDQQELRRNTGLYSDLYVLNRHTGKQQQLTRESRLQDPDLSPDGRTVVATREQRGRRDLVLMPLQAESSANQRADTMSDRETRSAAGLSWTAGSVTPLISEPEGQFNAPRWSPDGRSIAVARRRLGVFSEIVIVDAADGSVRTIASNRSTRFVTPAWRPDGRAIVAAADDDDGPFNLYEFQADGSTPTGRRLTTLSTGATWPDVSSDGRTIVFVGYTVDGYDLFTTPYPTAASPAETLASPAEPDVVSTSPTASDTIATAMRRYSPLPTLAPTSWNPILVIGSNQIRAGAGVGGSDVLGRHGYAVSATWLVDGPDGIVRRPDPVSPDWQVFYAYNRWRPTLVASASRETVFGAGPPDAAGRPTSAIRRSRDAGGGVLYSVAHVRAVQRALAAVVRTTDRYTFADHDESRIRNAFRLGWAVSTARTFGYSISQEQGASIGAGAEVATVADTAASATSLTLDARGYLPGVASHHVVAVRAAAGWSDGDRLGRRIFHLGGNSSRDVIDFGYQAISLLRGFPSDSFAGSRVAVTNTDYRFPIARPQRGIGTLPLFLRNIHATLFADAGHAWTNQFRMRDVKVSGGAELSVDVVAGYTLPLTITAGAAWGRDGAGAVRGGTAYARVGRAF
jgi:hypothetical protein